MRRITAIILACLVLLSSLSACDSEAGKMVVKDGYSFVTPKGLSVAAVFLTIENGTNVNDKMIDFKADAATRTELHTMDIQGDMMRMRRVDSYDIPAGDTHALAPGGDHIMAFGMKQDFQAGDSYEAVAVFEHAGEIPVTIHVRDRQEMEMKMDHQ